MKYPNLIDFFLFRAMWQTNYRKYYSRYRKLRSTSSIFNLKAHKDTLLKNSLKKHRKKEDSVNLH